MQPFPGKKSGKRCKTLKTLHGQERSGWSHETVAKAVLLSALPPHCSAVNTLPKVRKTFSFVQNVQFPFPLSRQKENDPAPILARRLGFCLINKQRADVKIMPRRGIQQLELGINADCCHKL
jgi:hypothetical protein